MNIAGFRLYRYDLPLTEPLSLGGETLERRAGLLLKLAGEDGAVGWGESSPLPGFSLESLEEAASELGTIGASLLGREITGGWSDPGGEISRWLDAMTPVPSGRFGLELAVWNLCAAAQGASLAELVSPSPSGTVMVNGLLTGPLAGVHREARGMRNAGYRTVKLKVGRRSVTEDAGLVRALAGELGEDVALRLDANRAWSLEEAGEFARAVRGSRFEYVEEPLRDPGLLPDFVRETGLPVALDESLITMEPEALGEHRYATAVVLKPTLLGGLSAALRFAGEASRLGMAPVVSSAYETGVGTAALVALAAAIDGDVPAGLDTYRRLADDVVSPRLALPAPVVDVRAACAPREILKGNLRSVG
ncbi:MAG TPA: o-succinylbenzoate synthase [Rubrobacteraceae bacterium]|nr:o-succinylbenzoate synthase [Rubrobacteraceae bacterium]